MRVLLIGLGNMGRALAGGWVKAIEGVEIHAIDPYAEPMDGVVLRQGLAQLPKDVIFDAVLLAVKPQQMDEALKGLGGRFAAGAVPLILSIAADTPIARFQAAFGEDAPIVRAMPNTPALIGQGMTGLCASPGVGAAQRALAERLMAAVGKVSWLADESAMDAFTALAGSGPAYVFYLIESMRDAGVAEGLSPEVAAEAALQTVLGAAMLAGQSDEAPEELRVRVTSPGGTTQAALERLMDGETGLGVLMKRAIAAATQRGRQLGNG